MQAITVERVDSQILLITMNRPANANALNTQMAAELCDVFTETKAYRVVILTGAGERAFCAGADLKERLGMDEAAWRAQRQLFEQAYQALLNCPIPVIAAVNGAAYGGGLELALGCDFIYAAETARFALPEATRGLMPGLGGSQLLPRTVGVRRANQLLFTGESFSADEALAWGLVNRLCPPPQLLEETLACARRIMANSPLSIRTIKKATQEGLALALPAALRVELSYYNLLVGSADSREGIHAFVEKRQPIFQG
jgi:enoyl-CoA hydratase/carnithine racemase